jgi:hypothetical protein
VETGVSGENRRPVASNIYWQTISHNAYVVYRVQLAMNEAPNKGNTIEYWLNFQCYVLPTLYKFRHLDVLVTKIKYDVLWNH